MLHLIDFAEPRLLYLLLLLPAALLIFVWSSRARRRALARWGTPALVARLSANLSYPRRRWKALLWLLALALLVLAIARPRWGTVVVERVQRGIEVMVVLDVSTSMLAEDLAPNRLARAKLTIQELFDQLAGHDVGLVLFAGAAFVQFPLTADLNTARLFLDAAETTTISRQGTALDVALQRALDSFSEERSSDRVILLLTDGEGHTPQAMRVAERAAASNVVIHTVGLGSPEGAPIPVRDEAGALVGYKEDRQGQTVISRLDETQLRQIAAATGGLYGRVGINERDALDGLVAAINRLEGSERSREFETTEVERFPWFVGAALLFLTVELLIGERKGSGQRAEGRGQRPVGSRQYAVDSGQYAVNH